MPQDPYYEPVSNPEAVAAAGGVVHETRELAGQLTFRERADFLRDLVKAVRDAVEFDPLPGGSAPQGHEWELSGLGSVGDAAERYNDEAREEHLRAQGRLT